MSDLKTIAFEITETTYHLAVAILGSDFTDHPKEQVLGCVAIFYEPHPDIPIDNRWVSFNDFVKYYDLSSFDGLLMPIRVLNTNTENKTNNNAKTVRELLESVPVWKTLDITE